LLQMRFFLSTGPFLSDLKGELSLETLRKSWDSWSSDPYPNLDLQRPELGLVDVAKNLWLPRWCGFCWSSSCSWIEAKKASNSWFHCPRSPWLTPINEG
jgi:hypothetical protein